MSTNQTPTAPKEQWAVVAAIESPKTQDSFVEIFKAVHRVGAEEARQIFESEKFNFLRQLMEKSIDKKVTPVSVKGVFLEVISNGMSFAEQAKHVYVMTRNVKVKTADGKDAYETRLTYQASPDGKIFQCQRAGSIQDVTKPVIVYEGDDFSIETDESGRQIIRHKVNMEHTKKIVAGYVFMIMKDGSREPFWLDLNDIERLKAYSSANNSKWDADAKRKIPGPANALYTSNGGQIDPGFFGAKLISHALKNKRKSRYANQFEAPEEMEVPETYFNPGNVDISQHLQEDENQQEAEEEITDAEVVDTPPPPPPPKQAKKEPLPKITINEPATKPADESDEPF